MDKYRKIAINSSIILSITFMSVFISEFLVRGNGKEVIQWMKYYDMEFLLTYLLVLGLIVLLVCLINKVAYGYLLTIVPICTISIINYYKLDIKGEQLSIQDFALAGELATMAGDLEIHISPHLIWGCTLALVIFLILRELDPLKLRRNTRILTAVGCIMIIWLMHDILYAKEKLVKQGFLLTLVNSARINDIAVPRVYNEEKVKEILQDIDRIDEEPIIKPNVILIMSESFFDLRRVEGVILEENPYKYFDQYCDQFSNGTIIGPKIGGYTAQTEYEVLTGNSTDFTGVNNIAYLRYIKPEIHSLVSVFKKQGYKEVAIHPYDEAFYSRDKVYRQMGFEQFITRRDFDEPELINNYISDQDTFQKIIESYESSGEQPFFAHVVTMQNHTPYDKQDRPTIHMKNKDIDSLAKDTIESYASCIYKTDQALHELISYFEKVNEPTVMMFFGDHIPIMGDETYEAFNFFEIDKPEDYLRSATTPYLIWNNYGLVEKDTGPIDSSYLGAVLLDYIGFKQDRYFNYLYNQMAIVPGYHAYFYVNHNGEILEPEQMTQQEEAVLENLWILQYDELFGKRYGGK